MFSSVKGVAMLVVISMILMLLILGGAVSLISTGHFGTSYHQVERTRAYYAAEAAMQHILWALRTGNPTALPANFDVNGIKPGNITVSIGNSGATLPGVQKIDIVVKY